MALIFDLVKIGNHTSKRRVLQFALKVTWHWSSISYIYIYIYIYIYKWTCYPQSFLKSKDIKRYWSFQNFVFCYHILPCITMIIYWAVSVLIGFQLSIKYVSIWYLFPPETLKYLVGVQQGQYSYGESASLALFGHPCSHDITIEIPYGVDVLLHYFPIGLVKTESNFIVRSVEAGLGRWTLVVAD